MKIRKNDLPKHFYLQRGLLICVDKLSWMIRKHVI